ncbi:MAG: hypothetical protein WCL18_05550 [bacterium]
MEKCTQIYDGKEVRNITEEDKHQIEKYIEESSNKAMRNLAFAYKPLQNYESSMTLQEVETDLIFLGCTSIIDPPREEVASAIVSANEAKIKIIMITGDYGLTAEAIARRIGLEQQTKIPLIAGEELKITSDIQLIQILQTP